MRRQAEERARRKAEDEARLRAEIEAELRAEAGARRREEEEARRRAEAEARQRAEEEAQRLAAEQARRRAEEEAQRRAEAEARRQAEEAARIQAEAEARRQAEEQARLRAAQAERDRQEAETRERLELEGRIRAEIEAKLRAEDEERRRAETEARRQAEHEQRLAGEAANAPKPPFSFETETTNGNESKSPDAIREITPWFEVGLDTPAEPETGHRSSFADALEPEAEDHESEFRAVSVPEEPEPLALNSEMRSALKSNSVTTRASAVAGLSNVGGEDAYQRITAAFDDPSPEVRSSAARALFELQDDRAAAFTRALREAEPDRRRAIGAAISSSGLANEAISNLTGESRDKTYDAFSLLFLMSKAGEVRPLMRAIEEHPNTEVRLAVIKLLALSGQPEVLAAFRRMAVRGSLPAEVRSAVMEAIYQITSQSSAEAN
jgi:hypothetical protein